MNTPRLPVQLSRILAAGALAAVVSLCPLHAVSLPIAIDFNTDDGTADTADYGVYQWNNGGGRWSVVTSTTAGLGGTGNALRNGGGGTANTKLYVQWDTVTLSDIGDSVTVSLRYRSAGVIATNRNFDIALLDSNQAFLTADPVFNGPSANDPARLATGFAYELTDTPSVQITEYVGTFSAAGATQVVRVDDAGAAQPGIFDTLAHTLTYSLIKTETGVTVSFSADNGYSYTSQQSFSGDLDLNTLLFKAGTASFIDDISVTYSTVPEPSTYAVLAGVAVLGLAATRRRFSRLG